MSTNGGPTLPPPDEPGSPTGTASPVFQLATWFQRAGGLFIDGAIVWAILIVGTILNGGEAGAIYFLFWLAAMAFNIWQLWQQGVTGQTIGKKLMGMKLVSESNAQPIGGGMSIARGICHIVDAVPCFIGFLFPIWDSKRQTFADKILKTVVITVPR